MRYSIEFEIAALLIMAIIFLHFLFVRQFPTSKTRIFHSILVICILECSVNIFSSIGLQHPESFPLILNKILVFMYFVLMGLGAYFIFQYVAEISGFWKEKKILVFLVGTVPFLSYELLVLATPLINFFYYFEQERYQQGIGANFGYYFVAYYFILDMILLLIHKKIIDYRIRMILFLYSIAAVAGTIIQYNFRDVQLSGMGNAILILLIYMGMQNPSDMLDSVTGAGNESAFMILLSDRLEQQKKGELITVVLKQYHHISSILGYENSNHILVTISQFLYNLCGEYHVFHNSGDTFTILVDEESKGEIIRQKILERFGKEWSVQQNKVMIHVVMILQHYPQDFNDIAEYMGMRDYLLEEAKTVSNMTVLETNQAIIEKYKRRMKVEMALNNSVMNKSFDVYYQPIYSIREKRITSLEALVRLYDLELGYISPEEFIPLAEKNGNIIHLGEQVLESSCRFLAKYVLADMSLGIHTIHINVSVAQCLQKNLAETIIPILNRYHMPSNMIILEVTERTAISTPDLMKKHMERLRKVGISFAMDDYGSGNSNCSYLVQFPFQEVKIDKEIVWAAFKQEDARVILESEIRTIQKLGLPIVVEGIENDEQNDVIEALGVDYIQGFYYGYPMNETECLRYIRKFNSDMEDYSGLY